MIPRKYLDDFAREHPIGALLVCAWGLGLLGFAVWLIVSDWR
jgi:hypothetical protein